ncbi:MAG: hypothetical protein ACRD2Z_13170 [Thermoanaerobaculia bacterium]
MTAGLSATDARRLGVEVLNLALEDARSGNGHSREARRWLLDPQGGQRVVLGLGWPPEALSGPPAATTPATVPHA